MTVGENIKRIRKEKGFTQKDLAERLHVTQSAIGQFEKNKKPPKTETIIKIAKALNVNASELMKDVLNLDGFNIDSSCVLEEIQKIHIIENFFQSLGFSIEYHVTAWHYENLDNDLTEKIQIVDDAEYILTKEGNSVSFSQKDFDELQNRAKETIEGIFYKKLALSKNK